MQKVKGIVIERHVDSWHRRQRNLQASDPKALRAAPNHRWNSGYVECFDYLSRMLPLPAATVEQQLSIFIIYGNAVLSAHEAAQEARLARSSRLWGRRSRPGSGKGTSDHAQRDGNEILTIAFSQTATRQPLRADWLLEEAQRI